MAVLDLDRLAGAPLVRDPFDHVVVPGFVRAEAMAAIARDFPPIRRSGSFPLDALDPGPAFRDLAIELGNTSFTAAMGDRFAIDLTERPTVITVRGHARAADGRIHTDSKDKIVAALIYLNVQWNAAGGRLRLLHDGHDLDRVVVEVPPIDGTLVAFRRGDRSFHGHKPYVGPRRVVQVNWVRDTGVAAREILRHRFAARLKRLV